MPGCVFEEGKLACCAAQFQDAWHEDLQGECPAITGFFQQQVNALTAHHFGMNAHGGKRWEGEAGGWDIVHANERDILRDRQPLFVDST